LATVPVFQTGEGGFDSPAPLHRSKREESRADRLPSSRGCIAGISQSWRPFGRARAGYAPASSFFAPSTQGERARPLTGTEAGSIPAGRANPSRRVLGTARIPNPPRSVRFASAGANTTLVRWSKGEAPACKAGPCRFESGSHLQPSMVALVNWRTRRAVNASRRVRSP
jgi:hypothetical protein